METFSKTIQEINLEVLKLWQQMNYRPCVVAVVVNGDKVLLVQSTENKSSWGPPQGGIKKDEDVVHALFRELEEETGISENDIASAIYSGGNNIDLPDRDPRDGFKKGKHYYYFLVILSNLDIEIALNPDEVHDYKWVSIKDVDEHLTTTNQFKIFSIKTALGQ